MSRIGKLPVLIPSGVNVEIDGRVVKANGPKGALALTLPRQVEIKRAEDKLIVEATLSGTTRWGLARTLVNNLIQGVNEGFTKQLEIQGVGYRAQVEGRDLVLSLGFSHPIKYTLPEGIETAVDANQLTISGIDKQLVGQVAAEIRGFRPPEPYKGKGIRYVGENVRRKVGKTAGKVTG